MLVNGPILSQNVKDLTWHNIYREPNTMAFENNVQRFISIIKYLSLST